MRRDLKLLPIITIACSLCAVAEERVVSSLGRLEPAEVEFIMELSMMQRRARSGLDSRIMNPALDEMRAEHFLDSLYAIARADGITTSEELEEILAISAEFGLTGREPD